MTPLDTYINVIKIIWPIAVWVAWVNHNVKQNRKDIDHWYYMARGGHGKRCRTVKARFQRATYKLRKGKPNGNVNEDNADDNQETDN